MLDCSQDQQLLLLQHLQGIHNYYLHQLSEYLSGNFYQLGFHSQGRIVVYNYQSKEVGNLEEYESNFMVNIGLFSVQHRSDKLKTYSGFRLGVAMGKEKSIYTSSNEEKSKAFLFGPSVGAEFFLSDYVSFGGECTFRIIKGEKEGYDYQGNNEIEKESTSILTPTLMIRFYF